MTSRLFCREIKGLETTGVKDIRRHGHLKNTYVSLVTKTLMSFCGCAGGYTQYVDTALVFIQETTP